MPEKFISEAIKPVRATFDTGRMKAGDPGLPRGINLARAEVQSEGRRGKIPVPHVVTRARS